MTLNDGQNTKRISHGLGEFEEQVAKFEDAWFSDQRPAIEAFLPRSGDALRYRVLRELIAIDLECRLTAGESARAETYAQGYPDVAADAEYMVDLLAHEFKIRQQRENVSVTEYAARFPQHSDQLRLRLSHEATINWQRPGTKLIRCPHCCASSTFEASQTDGPLICPHCNEEFEVLASSSTQPAVNGPVRMGRFELLEVAGRGAFGTVWRARDSELDRLVALKIPSSGRMTTLEEEERFLREARSMAQLRHAGIVPVFESGRCDGVPYIVAEFIHGTTLSQAIVDRRFSVIESAELLRRVARALDYAHQHGIVHRDLKPSNIMLDTQPTRDSSKELQHATAQFGLDYEPRVMDFGLALRETAEATVTVDGQIVGTAAYMSPEQARGQSHHVDRRSDVYSAGVILYEMLVGESPFRGNIRMVLQQVLDDEPRPIRRLNDRVPRDMETIALKCMEKEPRNRYQTAGELADELERFLTHRPIAARPIGRMERSWRWCKRHPLVASLTGVIVAVVAIGFASVTWQWLATKQAEHGRTLAQVDSLLLATPEAIPTLLSSLAPYWSDVAPLLRHRLSDDEITLDEKLRAHLGLLAEDASHAEPLFESLFSVDMKTFLLVRERLLECPVDFLNRCWELLNNRDLPVNVRFRAACYLAAAPPASPAELDTHADFVVDEMLTEVLLKPSEYSDLSTALRPMASELIAELTRAYRDVEMVESRRRAAANLLTDYAKDDTKILADLLLDAEPWQFSILMPVIEDRHRAAAVDYLRKLLTGHGEASESSESSDTFAKQRANAAIALIQLDAAQAVWPLLASSSDMSARSYFIDRFALAASDAEPIINRLRSESNISGRRALYLTLGGFSTSNITEAQLASLKPALVSSFRQDPDAGIHAAIRWLLTRWGLEKQIDDAERDFAKQPVSSATKNGSWHMNSQGHTMLVHGPATFQMGSPPEELGRYKEETWHERRIDRTFAIAMCETTIEQYEQFDPEWRKLDTDVAESDKCPVYFVSYSQAAAYCNWLSQKENIPEDQWCYVEAPENAQFLTEAENGLTRTGYRLPTEAEWEYACRGGTTTARFFGHAAELLPQYAWCPANSPLGRKHPVGLKKPNDAGMFDVYGNADEICHDRIRDSKGGSFANLIVTRGGAAGDLVPPRSALRNFAFNDPDNPHQGALAMGFRVARTIAVEPTSEPNK